MQRFEWYAKSNIYYCNVYILYAAMGVSCYFILIILEKEKTDSGKIMDLKVLKRLFVFAKPYKKYFRILVLLTILIALVGPIRPIIVKMAIDNDLSQGNYAGLVDMILILVE